MKQLKASTTYRQTLSIYILIIVFEIVIAIQNSLVDLIDSYAPYNWIIDYSLGFCKRGFIGTIYHLFLGITESPFNLEALNDFVSKAHIIVSLASAPILLHLFYSCLKNKYYSKQFLLILFIGFISSSFIKNCYSLTGYTDLYLFALFLIILLCFIKEKYSTSVILCLIATLISELSLVFWLPLFLINLLDKKKAWKNAFLLSLPIFTAIIVSLYHYPLEHLKLFAERFGIDSSEISKEMIHTFEGQRNLIGYITERFLFLKNNFQYCLYTFLFTSAVSLFYFIIAILRLRVHNKLNFLYSIIVFICIFSPQSIHLLAVDFWRICGFSVFSGFITCLYLELRLSVCANYNGKQNSELHKHKTSYYSFILLYLSVSLFTLFLPPLRSNGWLTAPYTPTIFKNSVGIDPFIFNPLLIDTDLYYTFLARFNFDTKDVFNHQEKEGLVIPKDGVSYFLSPQAYGLTRITISPQFNDNDPDSVKIIYIFNYPFEIKRQAINVFEFYIPPAISKQFPVLKISALKSSHDWRIEKISLDRISK